MDFGSKLKAERVRRNLSIEDLSRQTKVSEKNLHALEAGDYAVLPGGVFRRGIVRAYLAATGLADTAEDETVWLELFQASAGAGGQADSEAQEEAWEAFARNVQRNRIASPRPGPMRWVGVAALTLLLLAVGYLVWHYILVRKLH